MRSLSANIVRVLISSFFAGMGISLSFLFMNFHLESIGFSRELIGYANAIPALSMVFFGIPAGLLIPRFGYVRSLYAGGILSVLGALLLAWGTGTTLVFVALLAFGMGQGLMMGASTPLLTQLVPEAQRVTIFSWHAALGTGAGFLGNLIGGLLPRLLGGPSDVMAVVPLILLFSILPLVGMHHRPTQEPKPFRMHQPALWVKLILPQFLVSVGAGTIMPFLNLYLGEKFSLSYEVIGGIFAFSALATMGAMLIQPWLAGRFGKVGAIVAMQAASLPFILVLAYVPLLPLVTLALFIRGALMNAANPVYMALAMELMEDEERSTFTLAQAALWNVGWALGSTFSGRVQSLYAMQAFDYLFAGMLALYMTATLCYILFFGVKAPKAVLAQS